MKTKKRILQQWPQKRKCLVCGKEFEVDKLANRKKYCSAKCSSRYRYIRDHNINWPKTKKCLHCGKKFKVNQHSANQKYCCFRCRRNYEYRMNHPKVRKICFYCKKEFMTNNSKGKYCSVKCKIKYLSCNRKNKPSKAYLKRNFPYYSCQKCGYKYKLNFDPTTQEGILYMRYMKCPNCFEKHLSA